MANEFSTSIVVNYTSTKGGAANFNLQNLAANQAGYRFSQQVAQATTGAGAIPLPSFVYGWMLCQNLDTSSTVYFMNSLSGVRFGQLGPLEVSLTKLGPDVTTPAFSCNTLGTSAANVNITIFEL